MDCGNDLTTCGVRYALALDGVDEVAVAFRVPVTAVLAYAGCGFCRVRMRRQ